MVKKKDGADEVRIQLLEKEPEELADMLLEHRAEISGLDRKNSKLEEEIEKLRGQSSANYDMGAVEEKLQQLAVENERLNLKKRVFEKAETEQIPFSLAAKLMGDDWESSEKNLDELKDFAEDVKTGFTKIGEANAQKVGSRPQRVAAQDMDAVNPFSAAKLARMTENELRDVPADILTAVLQKQWEKK